MAIAKVNIVEAGSQRSAVIHKMRLTNGQVIEIHNPIDMPDVVKIAEIEEPWIEATIPRHISKCLFLLSSD
jgi:translation elongation factor EF-4